MNLQSFNRRLIGTLTKFPEAADLLADRILELEMAQEANRARMIELIRENKELAERAAPITNAQPRPAPVDYKAKFEALLKECELFRGATWYADINNSPNWGSTWAGFTTAIDRAKARA